MQWHEKFLRNNDRNFHPPCNETTPLSHHICFWEVFVLYMEDTLSRAYLLDAPAIEIDDDLVQVSLLVVSARNRLLTCFKGTAEFS